MADTLEPTWSDVEEFVDAGAEWCGDPVGVYGPPRGGLVFGAMLSHKLHVPMLLAPCDGCLIVDDICDTGETMQHYRNSLDCKIATMYFVEGASVTPDMWLMEKERGQWVVFPWERA